MSPAVLLSLVLLASFALISLALSGLLALAWRVGLRRAAASSWDLVALRLLPSAGALLITLGVALPAFLSYEPPRAQESVGPLVWVLALLAGSCLAHGLWRGWRACEAARTLLKRCALPARAIAPRPGVHVLDAAEPFIAVVGAWRPRIIATASVRAACNTEEFREVLAHEAAHITARDNLKLLALLAAPDVLAWTRLGATLTAHWRARAERDADQHATGADARRRLALASALIKVARLLRGCDHAHEALRMPVASDDVPGRVRRLLGPPDQPARAVVSWLLAACALLLPLLALPGYGLLHEFLEQLVKIGR